MAPTDDSEPRYRRHSVTSTVLSEQLAGLNLAELRDYRSQLVAEEDKVSYWRRVGHARMDMLEAEAGAENPLGFDDLVRILGDTGTGRTRRALLRIKPFEPLPDLPALSEMWDVTVEAHDPESVAAALEGLRASERQLTEYRRALHELIDDATRELILRYRENPRAALATIPVE